MVSALSEALCFSGGGVAPMHLRAGLLWLHLHLQSSSLLKLSRLPLIAFWHGQLDEVCMLGVAGALFCQGVFFIKVVCVCICMVDVWRALQKKG